MGKDESTPTKEGMPLLGFSVLVVNEDLGNRELASHILEELGACVDKAEQAVEAIEAIKHQQYHAVLIDEEIMCTDSEDITGLVKARSRNPNTAVIISGSLMVTRNEAIISGADGYIEKPLDENEVLQSLISSQKQH